MFTLDDKQARIFRLGVTVPLLSITAVLVDWPLAYVAPVLLAVVLGEAKRPLPLNKAVLFVLVVFIGQVLGLIFNALFLGQTVLAILILALIFFWIYYLTNLGKLPQFASVMLIIGITLLPLTSTVSSSVSYVVALGLVYDIIAAIGFSYIGFYLFPPSDTQATEKQKAEQANGPDLEDCRQRALISTLVVLPAMIFFIAYEILEDALIIAFVAILSLNPVLENARKAGMGLILGNLLGGGIAMLFFFWMVTNPFLGVYISFMAAFSLFISRQIHSGGQHAAFWGMALNTMLILIGGLMTGGGGEADAKFITRILQIFAAVVYMVYAIRLVSWYWPVILKVFSLKPTGEPRSYG